MQLAYFKEDGVFDIRKIFDLRKFLVFPKTSLNWKFTVLSFFKEGDTIQGGALFKEIR